MRYYHLPILALSGFVTSFGAHIVPTNLPSYAEIAGVGEFMIGLLIAVYDLAELFAKPFAGFVADRRDMKGTLLVGLGVFIFGSFLFFTLDPNLLMVVRFVQGLGAASLSTVSISLVAKHLVQWPLLSVRDLQCDQMRGLRNRARTRRICCAGRELRRDFRCIWWHRLGYAFDQLASAAGTAHAARQLTTMKRRLHWHNSFPSLRSRVCCRCMA